MKVRRKPKPSIPLSLPASVVFAKLQVADSAVKTGWAIITPEVATKWLDEVNTNNRTLRQSYIARLANDMRTGRWHGDNGEAIRFDVKGRLVDGQHRLWACVQSKTPFKSMVLTGLDPEDYNTIGIGASKSFADFLGPVHGEKNVHLYSASVRLVYYWTKGLLGSMKDGRLVPTIQDLETIYRDHPMLKDSVSKIATMEIRYMLAPSYSCLIHYSAFCSGQLVMAEDFLERVGTGLGLIEDDPAYQIRKLALQEQRLKSGFKTHVDKQVVLARFIKAWNLCREGKKTKDIRFRPGEQFPKL